MAGNHERTDNLYIEAEIPNKALNDASNLKGNVMETSMMSTDGGYMEPAKALSGACNMKGNTMETSQISNAYVEPSQAMALSQLSDTYLSPIISPTNPKPAVAPKPGSHKNTKQVKPESHEYENAQAVQPRRLPTLPTGEYMPMRGSRENLDETDVGLEKDENEYQNTITNEPIYSEI